MNLGLATRLGRQGRGGATLVAHINPQEALIRKLLGGSGRRNPKTGLLEFKHGSDTKEGGARGTGGGAGTGAGGHGARHGEAGQSCAHFLDVEPEFRPSGTR